MKNQKIYSAVYLIGLILSLVFLFMTAFFKGKNLNLYICGKVFHPYLLQHLGILFWFTANFMNMCEIKHKKSEKVPKGIAFLVIGMVTLCLWGITDSTIDGLKDSETQNIITLSDGKEITMNEVTDYSSLNKDWELHYIYVYRTKGIIAEKIGEIDETYFSNRCIADGKYTYEYNESTKVLKIVCEYGKYGNDTVKLKPEYDTGYMDFEFQLE